MGAASIDDGLTDTDQDLEGGSDNDEEGHANKDDMRYKTCEMAFEEEEKAIAGLKKDRKPDGQCKQPFALAFSGGGMRAAAFQAGVLWRLAETDRLKDVDYFAAVSGGGYITTAFASHCIEAGVPKREQVKDWYLKVVAKTLCRMQDNAGNFVRDCAKDPGGPTDGNGLLPRIFDAPILVGVLLVTLMVGPSMLFFIFVFAAFNVDMIWGTRMRLAFCSEHWLDLWTAMLKYDWNYQLLLLSIALMLSVLPAVHILRRIMPCCASPPPFKPGKPRPRLPPLYLFGHATEKMFMRIAMMLLAFAFLPIAVVTMEYIEYSAADAHDYRSAMCATYMNNSRENSRETQYLEMLKERRNCTGSGAFRHRDWVCRYELDTPAVGEPVDPDALNGMSMSEYFWLWTLLFVLAMVVNLPFMGAKTFLRVLTGAIPLLTCFAIVQLSQVAVFVRITKNRRGRMKTDQTVCDVVALVAIFFLLLAVLFYEKVRSIFHIYYRRTLQSNFFAGGRDLPIARLLTNPYIPFILLTGLTSDYQPPGDEDNISELSFSPLHCGGEETGYVDMPPEFTLAKSAALSGAGALDAFTLAMTRNNNFMRFYNQVLSLSWGDFIPFDPHGCQTGCCKKTLIGALPWVTIFALQLVAYFLRYYDPLIADDVVMGSLALLLIIIAISFYNYLPAVDIMTSSWVVRLFHQTTAYLYVGKRPPHMLYVTDGGVRDCCAICQLLARKRERILLVLANFDPQDDLRVLRTALDMAQELRLAHFYDADDCTKSLSLTLDEFKDEDRPYLRIGISYCFGGKKQERKQGHLIVVKLRLPEKERGQPLQDPLTEEEIIGGEDTDESSSDLEETQTLMNASELGTLGCCDCCHARGLNCGPKFPHGSFANNALYLSPQFCSSLMRLGHDISGEAVEAITSKPLHA